MKKLLAMVLALVMTLSLAVSANAFKDDKSISDDYAESVAVLNGMGVFKGYEDGSFKPEGNITRAEVATIIYRIYTADVAKNDKSGLYATYNKFSDMAGAGWAQGYIGYCANASLVKGYPDGTFKPSGKVTGYEVLAMILRAVGYDKNNEFSGADWALHVAQTAQQLGVLDNVAKTTDLNAPASRELVAELLFQGIQKAQVTYTPAFGYVTDKVISTKTNSLGEKNFKLASAAASDKWGRPATKWTYTTGDKATTFVEKPDLTYTKAVAECDVAHDAGLKADTAYTLIVNGQTASTKYTVNLTDTKTKMGAQGRLFEVYDDTIVMIDTFLAKVTYVADITYDAQGHVKTPATITLEVYDAKNASTPLTLKDYDDNYGYAKDEYVLVNAYTVKDDNSATVSGKVLNTADQYAEIVSKATSVDGAQSVIYWNAQQHNVEGTVYDDAAKFYLDQAAQKDAKYTWYFDSYNNLIGAVEIAAATSYGVINSIWWAGNATDGSGVAKANVTYMDGTTAQVDISRTYPLGELTEDEKRFYTWTLQCHIDIAKAVWLNYCDGHMLDTIAREPLWQHLINYRCGTGHSVSFVGNVHEGPHALNGRNTTVFQPGMIVTDEPGVYESGVVGIRIENELECYHKADNQYGTFLAFRPLTFVPIATSPVVPGILTKDEIEWLNAYHREVFTKLAPRLTEEERDWLAKKCAAIGA